jgi:hypothetical protein
MDEMSSKVVQSASERDQYMMKRDSSVLQSMDEHSIDHKSNLKDSDENPNKGNAAGEQVQWRKRDDKKLTKAVKKYFKDGFSRIAKELPGKTK